MTLLKKISTISVQHELLFRVTTDF